MNNIDPTGHMVWWAAAALGGAAFDMGIYLFQHRNGGFEWSGLAKAGVTGAVIGVALGGMGKAIKGSAKVLNKGTGNLTRNVTKASQLNKNLLKNLKFEGTIKAGGRSGGARPLTGTPNSFVKTQAGHKLVYDSQGRLIYDISPERVKMTVWDKAPNGNLFPRDVKLDGPVPNEFLK